MRAFPVRLPSGQRYWTVLDDDLRVVAVADGFLRYQRFGRDGAESTTKAYAHAIALFLRWCAQTSRPWQAGVEQFASFMTWLAHAGPSASGADADAGVLGIVLAGPGSAPEHTALSSSEARAPVDTQNATSARSRWEGSRANSSLNTWSGICLGMRRGTRGRNRPAFPW